MDSKELIGFSTASSGTDGTSKYRPSFHDFPPRADLTFPSRHVVTLSLNGVVVVLEATEVQPLFPPYKLDS